MKHLIIFSLFVLAVIYAITFAGCSGGKKKHHVKQTERQKIQKTGENNDSTDSKIGKTNIRQTTSLQSSKTSKDNAPSVNSQKAIKKQKRIQTEIRKKEKQLKKYLAKCNKRLKKYETKLNRCNSKLTPLYSQKKSLSQQYKNAVQAVKNAKSAYLSAKKQAKKKIRYWYIIKAGIRTNKNLRRGKAPRGTRNVRYVYLKDKTAVRYCEQCKLNYENSKKKAAALKKELSDCKSKIHNLELCALNYKKEIKQIKLDIKRGNKKLEVLKKSLAKLNNNQP